METSTLMSEARLRPSSRRKRRAILDAAERIFVRDGYGAASVDDIAHQSGVSKQTLYTHFGSKQALFVEVVVDAVTDAFRAVHPENLTDPVRAQNLREHLERYGLRQLEVVLRPRLLGLRRLTIAETRRFPQLGHAFWTSGPSRAMAALSDWFGRLAEIGLLDVPDPMVAARTFNWVLMAEPLNAAMLLGDEATPGPDDRKAIATEATRVFLAAYAPHVPPMSE